MNYRTMNTNELETLAYTTGDVQALAALAAHAVESEEAFNERKQECETALTEADDWKSRYEDVKADIERAIEQLNEALNRFDPKYENTYLVKLIKNSIDVLECTA